MGDWFSCFTIQISYRRTKFLWFWEYYRKYLGRKVDHECNRNSPSARDLQALHVEGKKSKCFNTTNLFRSLGGCHGNKAVLVEYEALARATLAHLKSERGNDNCLFNGPLRTARSKAINDRTTELMALDDLIGQGRGFLQLITDWKPLQVHPTTSQVIDISSP